MAYEGLYIKKKNDDKVYETGADFDMYVQSSSVIVNAQAKSLYSVDWSDEDGLDEFIPDQIPVQQGEMNVSFTCKGTRKELPKKILTFINFLRGGEMEVYDKYYDIGKKGVRFESVSDNATVYEDSEICNITYSVTFKVNDPLSDVKLV